MLSLYSGLSAVSSSLFACSRVVVPYLRDRGVAYRDDLECYERRHERREQWYRAIRDYNRDDKSRLAASIFGEHDIYVGIRDREEYLASRGLAIVSFWIDSGRRVSYRDPTCGVTRDMCDVVVDNNGTIGDLERQAKRFGLACRTLRFPGRG